MFHPERAHAVASIDLLKPLDAGLLLPGHGPALRGPVAQAAEQAWTRAPA